MTTTLPHPGAARTAVPRPRPASGGTALATGLARLTIHAPHRRLDLALPEDAPLAELLPDLLRHAGPGLADEGQEHGGWVLRRADGSPLSVGAGLAAQGVRDGEVLYLGAATGPWPELEYDDVVDAIATGARRYGQPWSPMATRATGIGAAGVALLGGAALLLTAPGGLPAGLAGLGVALLLVLGGTVLARAYGDQVSGAALAAYALPYAVAGGARLPVDGPGAPRLLLGSAALLVVAALATAGVGYRLRYPVAGLTAGLLGCLGSLVGYRWPAASAAAVVLAVVLAAMSVVPLLAIRLGQLPVPGQDRVTDGGPDRPVDRVTDGGSERTVGGGPDRVGDRRPDRTAVYAAVARTDEIQTGLLSGAAIAAGAGAFLVTGDGGTAGLILALFAAAGLLARARLFQTVRARLPLLAGGLVAGAAVVLDVTGRLGAPAVRLPGGVLLAALVGVGLLAILAGARYRIRPPGPYLGRLADAIDTACVVGAIPAACAVLGLYGRLRGIAG